MQQTNRRSNLGEHTGRSVCCVQPGGNAERSHTPCQLSKHSSFTSQVTRSLPCTKKLVPGCSRPCAILACIRWVLKRHWKRRALANATRISELTTAPLFRSWKHLDLAVNSFCPPKFVPLKSLMSKHLNRRLGVLRKKRARLRKPTQNRRFLPSSRKHDGRLSPNVAVRPGSQEGTPPFTTSCVKLHCLF